MTEQVKSSGRHFAHPQALAEVETSTREQRALFDFLRVKTMYPHESYDPNDFALYPGWLEYLQTMDMLPFCNARGGGVVMTKRLLLVLRKK
jgi:hypothetical protein